MLEPHQHSEIELNLVTRGRLTYLFGAQLEHLDAGRLSVFWGTLPHRLLEREPLSRYIVLTLPLAAFLRFNLPDPLVYQVLHGLPVMVHGPLEPDLSLFRRWQSDLTSPSTARGHIVQIVQLELEARLRRLNLSLESETPQRMDLPRHPVRVQQALEFAALLAEHYLEPLTPPDLAQRLGLHPHYAATLFREVFGQTPTQYLTQYRVAHAQRLLLTTSAPVISVALESGFGSLSRFYSAFGQLCGQSPLEYRRTQLG